MRSGIALCALAGLLICGFAGPGDDLAAQSRSRTARRSPRDFPLFVKQHTELHDRFAKSLGEVADFCTSKGMEGDAEYVRLLAAPLATDEVRFVRLPRKMQEPLPNNLPPDEHFWQTQVRTHREEYARHLFMLSRRALNAGYVGFAYDLVRETAVHDSDHSGARKILGFVRNGKEWISPFEASMLKARPRRVWHDQFGWIPRDHVDRYERGERFFDHRWMSAVKEAELRHDFRNAWEVRTEHYLVKTNHSLERGVELAKKLEDFHDLFFQTMAGFFNTAAQARQLFEGQSRPTTIPIPNEVHFYRQREEYIYALKQKTTQPVEITRGMYFPQDGIAYFYDDPEAEDDSTLYHEATHQLLAGSRPQSGAVGMRNNFWIIEGIACYMESFRKQGDRFLVGDSGNVRMRAAQVNLLNLGYYVPLRDFSRMGMVAFQTVPTENLRKNYSQSAAMAHFFMHSSGGRYREPLIEHLSQLYSSREAVRNAPDSLAELTGVAFEDLDHEYDQYIRSLVAEAAESR